MGIGTLHPPPPEAAVFDLDGVITRTAEVHFAAWKQLFDEFLARHPSRSPADARAFTPEDYHAYVDGKPRRDGVRDFLASRGITLPPDGDAPDRPTLRSLGDRKNACFLALIERDGVPVDHAAVALVRELRAAGVRVGIATSSRNADTILGRAGLDSLFAARVDGDASEALGLRGKPAPDIFLECLRRLGSSAPARAIVVEDAAAGVAAGRAGRFGLVIGVDRGGNQARLAEAGAHWIVRDLREITLAELRRRLGHAPGREAVTAEGHGGSA